MPMFPCPPQHALVLSDLYRADNPDLVSAFGDNLMEWSHSDRLTACGCYAGTDRLYKAIK